MHYLLAVITKDKPTYETIKKLMAPYQENNMGDCPKEYLKFNSTREDCMDQYNRWTRTMYRDEHGELYHNDESRFEKTIKIEERNQYDNWHCRDGECFTYDYTGYTKIEIPYKDIWETFDEYLKDHCANEWDEEAQDYGYWENPNRKWDWYQIGGRYAGFIRVNENTAVDYGFGEKSWGWGSENPYIKDGDIISVDSARVKDIIQHDGKETEHLGRKWDLIVGNEEPKNEDERIEKIYGYSPQYYINTYGTKEKYIELESQFNTFAVITKDGKWYDEYEIGACKFKDEYKRLVFDNAEDDDFLTIVDYHI